MYLTSLYLTLNLDTEVSPFDRDRVLRSLLHRLKQAFGNRITQRADDDHALVIAFFEDKLERIDLRCEDIVSHLESAGEARIQSVQRQTFAWFEGEFRELEHERDYEDLSGSGTGSSLSFAAARAQTVVYAHEDEDDGPELIRRPSRRQLRIPVRK